MTTRRSFYALLFIFLLGMLQPTFAAIYPLPETGDTVVGEVKVIYTKSGDNFDKLSERYNVGYYGLVEANPGINPEYISANTRINIPGRVILPPGPKEGIVINLSELRLFYYPPSGDVVYTEPIGIGRIGWVTPQGDMKIIEKIKDPTWHVPDSVRQARLESEGITLPDSVPPGPENPLGKYALRLTERTYLIHGTNDPSGVGKRSSAGCIRMYPEAVEALFYEVKVGTPVRIIDEPYKIGWLNGKLYLESHVSIKERRDEKGDDLPSIFALIEQEAARSHAKINWAVAELVAQEMNGVPQIIGEAPKS